MEDIVSVLSGLSLRFDQAELQEHFDRFDDDKDGQLSHTEFKRLLDKHLKKLLKDVHASDFRKYMAHIRKTNLVTPRMD